MAPRKSFEASCSSIDLGSPAPTTLDGSVLKAFELKASGLRVQVLSWGCYISQIHAPDAEGTWKDVVIGFDIPDDFAGYHDGRSQYFGCTIGRFGNRIANGRFKMNGQEYSLAANNGQNHLHGGEKGWDKRNWEVSTFGCDEKSGEPFVLFTLLSADMEEGYPAAVEASVRYSIVEGTTLRIKYAVTNIDAAKSTVVNVTNHAYFNLSGDQSSTICDHVMHINAESITAVADRGAIPIGEFRPVEGTPFDFMSPKRIGDGIDNTSDEQIEFGLGYDHNFVLREAIGMHFCAAVFEPSSFRKMEVFTTEPGVQFYTGNFMDAKLGMGKAGIPLAHRTGFCLETQHFPDSPNQPNFPSTELRPGACYNSETLYRFSVGAPLKAPKWQKVEKVVPEQKGLNLMLTCVSCTEHVAEGNRSQSWEAVVGDETGILTLLLRSEKHASVCKEGASLRLQNAKVVMVDSRIRVSVDQWGVLKAADADVACVPNLQKDVSAVEYELK